MTNDTENSKPVYPILFIAACALLQFFVFSPYEDRRAVEMDAAFKARSAFCAEHDMKLSGSINVAGGSGWRPVCLSKKTGDLKVIPMEVIDAAPGPTR